MMNGEAGWMKAVVVSRSILSQTSRLDHGKNEETNVITSYKCLFFQQMISSTSCGFWVYFVYHF